jgi:hypothetical protein
MPNNMAQNVNSVKAQTRREAVRPTVVRDALCRCGKYGCQLQNEKNLINKMGDVFSIAVEIIFNKILRKGL